MKKVQLLLCLACHGVFAQVPDWAWYREVRGSGIEEARDVAVDAAGNIYVVGSFNAASVAAGTTTLTNSGGPGTSEIFLLKYDRTGTLQWARQGNGSDEDFGMSVAVDGSGNVFITGWFQSATLSFGSISVNNYTNTGFEDIFIAKYNASGTVQWAKAFGGTQQEYAYAIATDATGNCFITGEFYSLSVLFGSFGVINAGASDGYITKLDPAGTPLWAKRLGGGNIDNVRDVTVDGSGNAVVVGSYNSASMNSFSPPLSNAGGFDSFYARYDGTGNNTLAGKFGGAGDEHAYAVTCGSSGEIFIMGTFLGGSLQLGSLTLNNTSGGDIYYVKLGSTGTPVWATRSSGSPGTLRGDLDLDASGDLYAAGAHNQSSFSSGTVNITVNTGFEGFVLKMSGAGGIPLWGRGTASAGAEELEGIDIAGGYVHVAGYYGGTLSIASVTTSVMSGIEGIVAKMCVAPPGPTSASSATVCAGTATVLTAASPPGTTPVWFTSASGGTAVATGGSFNTAVTGTYYVAARDTNAGCNMQSATRIPAVLYSHPPVNPSVSLSGHTLTAGGPGAVVAWLNCATGATLSGQTGGSYVLTTSGSYAVIMTLNGCRDTSACNSYSYVPGQDTVIITTGIPDLTSDAVLRVYPNPSVGEVSIVSAQGGRIYVTGITGNTVATVFVKPREAVRLTLPPGIYLIVSDDRRHWSKLIVSHE
jgi:hypothetical protein